MSTDLEKEIVDRMTDLWRQQSEFMDLLHKERGFPKYPVDLTSKVGQKLVKDISHDCMHELFESIHLLKNSKDHRKTEINEFDKQSFLEEISDVWHYLIEICILSGISHEELYSAYIKKGYTNTKRIVSGY